MDETEKFKLRLKSESLEDNIPLGEKIASKNEVENTRWATEITPSLKTNLQEI